MVFHLKKIHFQYTKFIICITVFVGVHIVIINPRRACAARVTVVGSVCLSVKSHLTSGASVRPENAVTYSAGNEGQKIWVFSETAPLQRSSIPSLYGYIQSAIFKAHALTNEACQLAGRARV